MEGFNWIAAGTAIMTFLASTVTAIFTSVVGALKASWDASHKWFAVGCGIFIALVWFGVAHIPRVPADVDTSGLSKQIAELSAKIDKLSEVKPAPAAKKSK